MHFLFSIAQGGTSLQFPVNAGDGPDPQIAAGSALIQGLERAKGVPGFDVSAQFTASITLLPPPGV